MSGPVLVTGAAGFIGSHLCEALLAEDRQVVGFDNLNDYYDPGLKQRNLDALSRHQGFEFVRGDIRSSDEVRDLFDRVQPSSVIHLAALVGVRASLEDPVGYAEVNVTGTGVLLEAARRAECERFLFASSSSVYGERRDPPFLETDRVDHPISPYAATKRAGELLCHSFHHVFGMEIACLRFFTVYGPRQRPEMAIHKFARKIMRGEPIPLFGDGTSRRDYTYVSDITAGIMRAFDRSRGYRIYNLGGAWTIALDELVAMLGKALGQEPRIERLPIQQGDVSLTSAGVDLAVEELGWRPAVGLEEGISRFVEWIESEGT